MISARLRAPTSLVAAAKAESGSCANKSAAEGVREAMRGYGVLPKSPDWMQIRQRLIRESSDCTVAAARVG